MMSIRARLTLLYGLVLMATMVAFAWVLSIERRGTAKNELARQAGSIADSIVALIERAQMAQHELTYIDSTGFGEPNVHATQEMGYLLNAEPGFFMVVGGHGQVGGQGQVLYYSNLAQLLPRADLNALVAHDEISDPRESDLAVIGSDTGRQVRLLLVARGQGDTLLGPNIARVIAGVPANDADISVQLLLGVVLVVAPVVALLSIGVAYLLLPFAFRPSVDLLVNEVEAISDGRSLHRRLATGMENDELSRLSGTLNAMLSRLEQSFGGLRRFTADASHELKTPLAVLRADVERSMHAATTPTDRMVALEEALQEIARMSDLVDSLLTLARADEGRFDLDRQPVHLEPLVRDVFETAAILGEDAGLAITLVMAEDAVVLGDETRLRHLLLNLVTNAIKYTPRGGGVEIGMSTRMPGEVVIAVKDTGFGIAAADLPHVFERFWRADQARSRAAERGGSGLGLAISQWIAQAHGGTLTVQSRLGRGSVFTVALPTVDGADRRPPHAGLEERVPDETKNETNSDFTDS